MKIEALTPSQKSLLLRLVTYAQNLQIDRAFVPIPAGPADYVIYVRHEPSLHLHQLSDLDELCAADLLDYKLNRMGNGKIYQLTKESFAAAAQFQHERSTGSEEPRIDGDASALKERLRHSREQLQAAESEMWQLMPPHTPADIRQRIEQVHAALVDGSATRPQLSHHLRRIGRYWAENLRDEQSAALVMAFGRWCQSVYRMLLLE